MGRSGGRSGGSRSGGGRSGGSRGGGRSGFSGGSSRSSRSFSSGRSGMGSAGHGMSGGFGSGSFHRPRVGGSFYGGGYRGFGGGLFGGGNVIINVDNHQEQAAPQQATSTMQQEQTSAQQTTSTTQTTPHSTKRSSGCFTSVFAVTVWMIVIYFLFILTGGSSDGITKSTVSREKLQVKVDTSSGYYTDECDWIRNRTVLEKGLKDFYDSTGIMPYVYIIDNVAGDYDPSTEKLEAFAEAKYGELFSDEGHILLLFWDYGGAYEYVLMLGYDTMELMDEEACDILFDYLDYYYYEAETEEEFFADAFAEAGSRMMAVTRSPVYYLLMIGGAVVVVVWLYRGNKSRKAKETERKKRAEEILNSPLEKFGKDGDIIDDLEKKYEKEL